MGPFELMNVTGVPIALHAAATLGRAFGPMYAPTATLAAQVQTGKLWDLTGTPDESRFGTVADRLLGVVFLVASALVSAGVSTIEDTDRGALVGLRWKQGPFGMMEQIGVERAETLADTLARQWGVAYSPITRV
jgi:enoyl-CoA hydratase/3-hydroxyacyl-CoA dehydrogenase